MVSAGEMGVNLLECMWTGRNSCVDMQVDL